MRSENLQEVQILSLVTGGDGLARVNGEVWFIPGGVPGDRLLCEKTEDRDRYVRARILRVLEASPDRVVPPCPYADSCGGCPWQHIDRRAQQGIKENLVRSLFERALAPDSRSRQAVERLNFLPMQGDGFSWRNRFQFHRSASADLARSPIGLMDQQGRRVIPLEDCPIAQPLIREALKTKTLKPPVESNRFTVFANDNTLLAEGAREEARIRLRDRDILMKVSLFFQSNVAMLEVLIDRLLTYVTKTGPFKHALDLYAGVGTFSLFLKDHCDSLTLMERDARSLAVARKNLKGRQAEYQALSDDAWARTQERKNGLGSADFALVDPPRAGLSARMRTALALSGIPRIACVSCDPASLARDCAALDTAGYQLISLDAFEFYPHSPHIESLAIMEKH